MIFSYLEQHAQHPLRKKVLSWAHHGIDAVTPHVSLPKYVQLLPDGLHVHDRVFDIQGKRIFVIGAGKASAAMAVELERIIGPERITAGMVISNDTVSQPERIRVHYAHHPIPSELGLRGTEEILAMKQAYGITADDCIIALMSGGGSSLMPLPVPGVTLDDKRKVTEALIHSGGSVHDITILKKKLSQVKGGKLAQHFYPTPIITLVMSDVVGNDLMVIASGPFAKDTTTIDDAWRVIEKYRLQEGLPASVTAYLTQEKKTSQPEYHFDHVFHQIIADNRSALQAMHDLITAEGIRVHMTPQIQGESRKVAMQLCDAIRLEQIDGPTVFLYGGETTVTLSHDHGIGGRNQEFVLSCVQALQQKSFAHDWCALSIGTDGVDFIPESAGGIIDQAIVDQAATIDVGDFLERHDSHTALKALGANLHMEVLTKTNVCDIMIFFLVPRG